MSVQTPALIKRLVAAKYRVYSALTPNVSNVAPPAPLMEVEGNQWIHHYLQDPLDRYPFGTMLVAPCTFNSFNKIALGLADNLALSMIADGLGAGNRLIIAPSFNKGLWAHPQVERSREQLEAWGCTIIPPIITENSVTMAELDTIMAAVD